MDRKRIASASLASVLFLTATALCVIASHRFINTESAIILLLFNFFFICLTFELNGTLNRKLAILALGNVIGLFWNTLFFFFAIVGNAYFGETYNIFHTIASPFLNFMWIISFWSLSIAALPKPEKLHVETKP